MVDAGVYDTMSSAEYFAETDWVSSSKLRHHLPEFYKAHAPDGPRDALDFGTAFHTSVLGVGEPILPVAASSWQTNAAKEQRQAAYASGQVPILEKQIPQLMDMAAAIVGHHEAHTLIRKTAGRNEVSVFADVDGVQCKARFDRLTDDGVAVDVKTTSAMPSEHAITNAIVSYGYDLQADHYLRVASAAGLDVDRFVFVFVGKDPPHYVTVVELDESFYTRAAVLRELALERIQHPEMVSAYPGANERLTVELPRWARLGP